MLEKVNNRKLQGQQTKEKIYTTAKAMFEEYGIENVSTRDIAKDVGVSIGAVYLYFPSKENIVACMIEEDALKHNSEFMEFFNLLDKEKPASDLIVEICVFVNDFMQRVVGHQKFTMFYKSMLDFGVQGNPNEVIKTVLKAIIEVYELGVARGELKEASSMEVALQIKTILCGLEVEWCTDKNNYFLQKTKEMVTLLMQNYISAN